MKSPFSSTSGAFAIVATSRKRKLRTRPSTLKDCAPSNATFALADTVERPIVISARSSVSSWLASVPCASTESCRCFTGSVSATLNSCRPLAYATFARPLRCVGRRWVSSCDRSTSSSARSSATAAPATRALPVMRPPLSRPATRPAVLPAALATARPNVATICSKRNPPSLRLMRADSVRTGNKFLSWGPGSRLTIATLPASRLDRSTSASMRVFGNRSSIAERSIPCSFNASDASGVSAYGRTTRVPSACAVAFASRRLTSACVVSSSSVPETRSLPSAPIARASTFALVTASMSPCTANGRVAPSVAVPESRASIGVAPLVRNAPWARSTLKRAPS